MRYRPHYSHKKTMAKRHIYRCERCEGEGFYLAGRTYETMKARWCSRCNGTGWNYEEADCLTFRAVRRVRLNLAA